MIIIFIVVYVSSAHASSAWEWNIFGITKETIKNRDPVTILVGCVSSIIVHELGHAVAASVNDMSPTFDFNRMSINTKNYDSKSNDQKALYHAGGFLGQVIVGSVLTIIPATRHHDFTLGFNTFTTIHATKYSITGGIDSYTSDVKQLTNVGYNGKEIAGGTALISLGLMYINMQGD